MTGTRSRLVRRFTFAAASAVLLLTTARLSAQDYWLAPDALRVTEASAPEVRGQTSSELPAAGFKSQVTDSADVAAVIDRYHKALASGDSAAALALLAPDAVILESGGVESRDEYRGHHLPGDISFARAVPSTRGKVKVVIQGDVAWASSTSVTQGKYRDRQINSAGAELMVLSRDAGDWKIRAIHWSSRTRRP